MLRTPDLAFRGELELDVGRVACRCLHVGGEHAPDSIAVVVRWPGLQGTGNAAGTGARAALRLGSGTCRS